jgi:hypothetical protein
VTGESVPEFTADDCVAIFHAALQTGDALGVEAALTLLAVRDPHRAQALLDMTRLALELAGDGRGIVQWPSGLPIRPH